MPKYTVTWSFETECDTQDEATHAAFIALASVAANPHRGDNVFVVECEEQGTTAEVDILEGVLAVEPLLVAQIVGFRHLIWVSQSQARK